MALLQIKDFSLRVGDHPSKILFDNISLTLHPGEKVGLIGNSGSGKTLLCYAILSAFEFFSLSVQVQGEILYREKSLLAYTGLQRAQLRLHEWAFIPQDPITFFDPLSSIAHTCKEILSVRYPNLSAKEQESLLYSEFEKIHLSQYAQLLACYPCELSRGTLQRIICSLCLAKNPQLLIADEPTSALDSISKMHIFERLYEGSDCAMLIASHDDIFINNLTSKSYQITEHARLCSR